MEKRRRKLLEEKEETWKLKSRAIWLSCGDENTKLFQVYARGRKPANTIGETKNVVGESIISFQGLAELGITHFQNLFISPREATIVEIIQITQFFPSFIDGDENEDLMAGINENELKEVLPSFQKDKSTGLDGWPIEFYMDFYEIIGKDLLRW